MNDKYEVGTRLIVTGDTAGMLHGIEPGTEVTVRESGLSLGDDAVHVTTPDGFPRIVGMADVKPVEQDPEKEALRTEVRELAAKVSELLGRLRDAQRALESFKSSVRNAAIAHAELRGECDEGLNEWLEGLGLEPAHTSWSYMIFDQHGNEVLSGEIDADEEIADEDEAIQWVRDRLSANVEDARVTLNIGVEGMEGSASFYDDDAVSDDWVEEQMDNLDISVDRGAKA